MSALICFTYLEVFKSMTVEKTTTCQLKWIFKFLQWIRKNWAKLLLLYSEASIEKANNQGEVLLRGGRVGVRSETLALYWLWLFSHGKEISSFFIKFTEAKKLPLTPIVVHLVVLVNEGPIVLHTRFCSLTNMFNQPRHVNSIPCKAF